MAVLGSSAQLTHVHTTLGITILEDSALSRERVQRLARVVMSDLTFLSLAV